MIDDLYEMIGGRRTVWAATESFYRRVLEDESVRHFFDSADMAHLRARQSTFISMLPGGQVVYTGKEIGAAHARAREQGLADKHFDAFLKHFRAALDEVGGQVRQGGESDEAPGRQTRRGPESLRVIPELLDHPSAGSKIRCIRNHPKQSFSWSSRQFKGTQMSHDAAYRSTRGFRVHSYLREGATVVECHGKLTAENAPLLKSEVRNMNPNQKRIILDLKEVSLMDSSGLGTIVGLYVSARTRRCAFELLNANQQIRELFGISNLLSLFEPAGRHGGKML